MKPTTVAVLVALAVAATAGADDEKYRYSYGAVPSWGSGRFSEVQHYARVREIWSPNYEKRTGMVVITGKDEARYKGDPEPTPTIAAPKITTGADGYHTIEYCVPGNLCRPKTVKPYVCLGGAKDGEFCQASRPEQCPAGSCVPGTKTVTGYPWSYIAWEYNNYGTWSTDAYPSGCIWEGYIYGAQPTTTKVSSQP